jgi:hypothetical protein
MKNIQTGNSVVITASPVSYKEQNGNYTIEAYENEFGDCSAIIVHNNSIIGEAKDWSCIDDALMHLGETRISKNIKWYAPQTLGI